jgi:hypothetical protein
VGIGLEFAEIDVFACSEEREDSNALDIMRLPNGVYRGTNGNASTKIHSFLKSGKWSESGTNQSLHVEQVGPGPICYSEIEIETQHLLIRGKPPVVSAEKQ